MQELLEDIKKGKDRAVARAITMVENRRAENSKLLKELYLQADHPYLLGITGPPGSGKSTLTEKVVMGWREKGLKVGIIAVDPTSQYSGGALLGDRVRMNEIITDRGVFIRSMATRGSLGGLNPAIFDTILILSAAGYNHIIIETVGVGQNEIDIVNLADTTLVVTVPEAGDEIQAFKAGLMEVGDVFVINKADRPEVGRMELIIKQMINMNERVKDITGKEWTPPVVRTIATRGEGIEDLLSRINEHFQYLQERDIIEDKREDVIKRQLINLMEDSLREKIIQPIVNSEDFTEKVKAISELQVDPYSAVEEFLKYFLKRI